MPETIPETPTTTRPGSAAVVEQARALAVPACVDSLETAAAGIGESTSILLAEVTVQSVPLLSDAELAAARILHEVTREALLAGRLEDVVTLARQWHHLLASRCSNRRLRQLLDEETRFRDALIEHPVLTREVAGRIVADHGRILELASARCWSQSLTDLTRSHGSGCC